MTNVNLPQQANAVPASVAISLRSSADEESVRQLSGRLIDIARSAGNSLLLERATVAATLVDLLTVAGLFLDESGMADKADEIIAYCCDTALPALAADDSPESMSELQDHIEDRWSDCLAILAPEERFKLATESCWSEFETRGRNPEPSAEPQDERTWQTGEPDTAAEHDDCRRIEFNLDRILATLQMGTESGRDTQEARAQDAVPMQGPYDSLPQPPTAKGSIDDPEMLAAYADDAHVCLAEMEAGLLNSRQGRVSREVQQSFCRQLHTLKGASGTVGLSLLATYLHQVESWLEQAAETELSADRLLECIDVVRAQLTALGIAIDPAGTGMSGGPTAPNNPAPALSAIHERSEARPHQTAGGTAQDGEVFVRVEAGRLERLMDLLAELVMLRNRKDTHLQSLRSVHDELNRCIARTRKLATMIEQPDPLIDAPTSPREAAGQTAHRRFLARSLEETTADTAELGRSLQNIVEPLSADNSTVSHLIGRFRQELMELRRLPVSGLFQRLQRAIHDAARAEGKQVEIRMEGQGARAERAIQERLFEPLLHLVRNAVSHGIQPEADRLRTGKSPCGIITLTAWSDAASLCLEVRDDGDGLNESALEMRGRELGLLQPGEPVTPAIIRQLIFRPGISTKTSVSEISGRGVGMDVVDNWIRKLRGRIDVESVAGQGTTFRLQIPLRSAVEHAMIVRAGGQLFALPMHAVSGTSDANLGQGDRQPGSSGQSVTRLSRILNLQDCDETRRCLITLREQRRSVSATTAAATATAGGTDRLAQTSTKLATTIAVDAIVGVEEVVVRSLPTLLQRNELFAGVTLSGRAESVLVLDAAKLIELAATPTVRHNADTTARTLGNPPTDQLTGCRNSASDVNALSARADAVLIVDDSFVVRRSLAKKLKAAGIVTREAANGHEALRILKSGGIAAVITDIDMPRMDGIALLQEMKHHKLLRDIPVSVLSSRDRQSLKREIADLRPTVVLTKPVSDGTIAELVRTLRESCTIFS